MTSSSSQPVSLLSQSFQLGDRNRRDGCPGAVRVHEAKDGGIGRIRVPGGQVHPHQWEVLADISDGFGDGDIHVTTRGNLQVRGITDVPGFAAAVERHGFLPSRAHDRVRNIVVSPFAPELLPVVEAIDAALLADDVVTGLSGRTLFGVDSGAGDVLGLRPDFGLVAHDGGFQLVLGGTLLGLWVAAGDAAGVLVQAARRWQEIRGPKWRVSESPHVQDTITAGLPGLSPTCPSGVGPSPAEVSGEPAGLVGWLPQSEGVVNLGAGLRFGQLSSQVARMLSVVGVRTTVTPWHVIVLHEVPEAVAEQVVRVLAPLGLVFDAQSPWLRISACTGSSGCEKSLSDTRGDALQAITIASTGDAAHRVTKDEASIAEGKVHFSGCERRCGHPLVGYTDYLATGVGEYEVSTR